MVRRLRLGEQQEVMSEVRRHGMLATVFCMAVSTSFKSLSSAVRTVGLGVGVGAGAISCGRRSLLGSLGPLRSQ